MTITLSNFRFNSPGTYSTDRVSPFGDVPSNRNDVVTTFTLTVAPQATLTTISKYSSFLEEICKDVSYADNGGVQVDEPVTYTMLIAVDNRTGGTWLGAVVTDTFGSDLKVAISSGPDLGSATLTTTTTKGKGPGTEKAKLTWQIGDLPAGATATLTLTATTDINPSGRQEYTDCGVHVVNGGANLKFGRPARQQQSFNTGAVTVNVVCPE